MGDSEISHLKAVLKNLEMCHLKVVISILKAVISTLKVVISILKAVISIFKTPLLGLLSEPKMIDRESLLVNDELNIILTDRLALSEGHLADTVALVCPDGVEEVKEDALSVCAAEKSLGLLDIDKVAS